MENKSIVAIVIVVLLIIAAGLATVRTSLDRRKPPPPLPPPSEPSPLVTIKCAQYILELFEEVETSLEEAETSLSREALREVVIGGAVDSLSSECLMELSEVLELGAVNVSEASDKLKRYLFANPEAVQDIREKIRPFLTPTEGVVTGEEVPNADNKSSKLTD